MKKFISCKELGKIRAKYTGSGINIFAIAPNFEITYTNRGLFVNRIARVFPIF